MPCPLRQAHMTRKKGDYVRNLYMFVVYISIESLDFDLCFCLVCSSGRKP